MPCLADPPYDVVLFLTDDMRADQLVALDETLARLGPTAVQFSRAYVTTPLCCPDRSGFLSGGFLPQATGVLYNDPPQGGATVFPDAGSLPTRIQAAGMPTALFGKYLNHYEQLGDYVPPGWTAWASYDHDAPWEGFDYVVGASTPTEPGTTSVAHYDGYVTSWHGEMARAFLAEHGGAGSLVYVSLRAPHDPRIPAVADRGAYDGYTFRGGAFNEPDVSDKPAWIQETPPFDDAWITRHDAQNADSYETLLSVDREIVATVDAVEAAGRLDRTVFLFTSDNGMQWGEHRLYGKGLPYEESVRVPLIVSHPDLAAREEAGLVAANLDLAATVQQLLGLPIQSQGESLVPVLCGEAAPTRDAIGIESWVGGDRPWAGVVTDRWKFIATGATEAELYDLTADPAEEESLHADPAVADVLADLDARTAATRGLAILEPTLPPARVGVAYDEAIPVAGGTPPLRFTVTAGHLPRGLALTEDGRVVGLPAVEASVEVEVTVEDASVSPYSGAPQRHVANVSLTVGPAPEGKGAGCGCAQGGGGAAGVIGLVVAALSRRRQRVIHHNMPGSSIPE